MGKGPSKPETPSTPKPETNINAQELVIREEHNSFPEFLNVNANGDKYTNNNNNFAYPPTPPKDSSTPDQQVSRDLMAISQYN